MGKATERIFLPLLRIMIPDIEDYHLPLFGCFHNCAFVGIRKAYALQARRVMHAIWGAGQMAWEKLIVVVDEDVDVHDEIAVLEAMFRYCDFKRDLESVNGPLDILDHAAARLGAGGKLGIDATRKIPGEEIDGTPIAELSAPSSGRGVAELISPRVVGRAGITAVAAPHFGRGRCVFVAVDKIRAGQGAAAVERVWSATEPPAADLVVAVDARVDVDDPDEVLFHLCANTDTARDLVRYNRRLGIDATTKMAGDERHGRPVRDYPPLIEMSDAIRQQVSRRRPEFGLAEKEG